MGALAPPTREEVGAEFRVQRSLLEVGLSANCDTCATSSLTPSTASENKKIELLKSWLRFSSSCSGTKKYHSLTYKGRLYMYLSRLNKRFLFGWGGGGGGGGGTETIFFLLPVSVVVVLVGVGSLSM